MAKIILNNITSKIVGHLPEEVHKDLNDTLSFQVPGARHMPIVRKRKWDGYVRLYSKARGQSFDTGLLAYVRETLDKHSIEYAYVDQRVVPAQNLPDLVFTPPPNYTERDYQQFTIDRAMRFSRGVLSVCTGGGKTMIVTELIGRIKTYPFIFYVLTKDLMEQAYDVLSMSLNEPIGRIGDGRADIQKITVCTIQTAIRALNSKSKSFKISDYQFDDEDKDAWDEKSIDSENRNEEIRKFIKSAKGIYFDETHHAAAKTCKAVLTASPEAYWRFGGSATPYRESGDGIMIQAMFGAKIVDISASYLIEKGFLVPPHIFLVPIDSAVDFHSYKKIYSHCIEKNDTLNNSVADTANHMVSRGLTCLVLVQHYPQGDYIKDLVPGSVFMTSRMTSKQRKKTLQDLREGRLRCAIATSLADEGLDVPILDSVILAGGGASATRINQRIGRTLRKPQDPNIHKDKSIVIAYEHNARFLDKHAKKTRSVLKKEKAFVVKSSRGMDRINDEIDQLLGYKDTQGKVFEL